MPSDLMQTFCPENIPVAISTFRAGGEIPVLDTCHMDGGQCRIFKAVFSDGESWSVRIPVHVQSDSQDFIISLLRDEEDILQKVGKSGFLWAPKHFGCSFTFENLVGFPFMVLSWIEGSPLHWTLSYPSRPIRNKILGQVAAIQVSLIECTQENKGRATDFFSRRIDNIIYRVRNGSLPGITEQDCLDQRSFLPRVLHAELEYAPYAIDHGDLAPQNIIVDSEYNITGIIDWGFASMFPLQLAGRLPRFLQLQELVLPPSPALEEDRKAYVASLGSHSSQVVSWLSLIQSSEDVDFRHCFLESTISKGMHRSLARLGWKIPSREQHNNLQETSR